MNIYMLQVAHLLTNYWVEHHFRNICSVYMYLINIKTNKEEILPPSKTAVQSGQGIHCVPLYWLVNTSIANCPSWAECWFVYPAAIKLPWNHYMDATVHYVAINKSTDMPVSTAVKRTRPVENWCLLCYHNNYICVFSYSTIQEKLHGCIYCSLQSDNKIITLCFFIIILCGFEYKKYTYEHFSYKL